MCRLVLKSQLKYAESGGSVEGSLLSILNLNSLQEGLDFLDAAVEIDADRSGVIAVGVEAESPGLAAAVANEFVEQFQRYYHRRRQTQSRGQLDFIEDRMVEIRAEMDAAQDALVAFRRHNLDVVGSQSEGPHAGLASGTSEKALEYERLSREVEMRSNLLATVMNRYEAAKVRAKGESPRFEVLSKADPPDLGSKTAATTLAGIGLAAGLLVGVTLSFARNYIIRKSASGRLDPILDELRAERDRVQRTLRWFRPTVGPSQEAGEEKARSIASGG